MAGSGWCAGPGGALLTQLAAGGELSEKPGNHKLPLYPGPREHPRQKGRFQVLCLLPLQVRLSVSPLPTLTEEDELLCLFGESPPHRARVEGDTVICNSSSNIPSTPPGQGEISYSLAPGPAHFLWPAHSYFFLVCSHIVVHWMQAAVIGEGK